MKKHISYRWGLLSILAVFTWACQSPAQSPQDTDPTTSTSAFNISKSDYGIMPDGQPVAQYRLENANGMQIEVITYGGIITKWTAPDKEGNYANVVLAYNLLSQYLKENPYFGALIGRYGNRIAQGQFTLAGKNYQLETNDGPNHLHGGEKGLDKVVWTATPTTDENGAHLRLTYTSPDMEGGYPGTLKTTVIYTLTADDELVVSYEATSDKTTIVNLTQHSYFNLSGDFTQPITDHSLTINADAYLPVDETLIPTGELRAVANTPFDFRSAKTIGQDIEAENEQLARGKGYDHCWVLNQQGTYRKVASAYHAGTGRLLEVFSDEPGIQFYGGNFLDGTLPMPNGGTYGHRTGFCLETQHYPDSPNQLEFPSVVLPAGEIYRSKTSYKFSVPQTIDTTK